MSDVQLRKALVRASFVHAKRVGFNDQAIEEACRDFGYSQLTAAVVRNGPIEVVDYAMEFWLLRLKEEMDGKQEEVRGLRIKDRIHLGIKTRL